MMGRQAEPEQLFYDFRLDDHVPADHLLRKIDVIARQSHSVKSNRIFHQNLP